MEQCKTTIEMQTNIPQHKYFFNRTRNELHLEDDIQK